MKKSLKLIALIAILSTSLCVLTGCGEDKKQNNTSNNTNNTANTTNKTNTTNTNNANTSSNTSTNTTSTDADEETANTSSTVIDVPMTVVNMVPDTTITELYLSGAGRETWGSELLGGQQLATGTQLTVTFRIDKENVKWDIRATDEVGQPVEFRNLDLSSVSTSGGTITLQLVDGLPVATAE